jgi:hypothetical protein
LSDYFVKYQFPETTDSVLVAVLKYFGFERAHDDEEKIFFEKGDVKLTVPKEDKIFGLTTYTIMEQSKISDEEFSKKLLELNAAS